jgi:glyoxylase-like metal-dependent hydrolase (beta-lactamase superfamily II)
VRVVSSAATQRAMQARCPDCLASLTDRVGASAMTGTRIVLPSQVVKPGDELPLGDAALQVVSIEQGHTEGDLVLWWPGGRVLWAGGLVYGQRVPELSQGSIDAWLQALTRLEGRRPRHVVGAAVSSSGRPGVLPPAMAGTRAYLQALRAGVLRAMDEGRQPQEAGLVPLPAFAHWAGYAERHAFNVQRAWRELEPVWMDQGSAGPLIQDIGR